MYLPEISFCLQDKNLETYELLMCELVSRSNDLKFTLFPKTSGAHI